MDDIASEPVNVPPSPPYIVMVMYICTVLRIMIDDITVTKYRVYL